MPDQTSPRLATPLKTVAFDEVVDCGVARLDLGVAAEEVTDFVEPPVAPNGTAAEAIILGESPASSPPREPERALQSKIQNPKSKIELERELRRQRHDVGFWGTTWATVTWAAGRVLWFFRCLFGIAAMIVILAFVSAIPGLNLIALGYLLDVEGRVARSGKLRDAFPLIAVLAPRLGSIVLGVWLCVLPLRFLSDAAADARIIDPGSTADRLLHISLPIACGLMIVHICIALGRGGSLGSFLWPLKIFWPTWMFRPAKTWHGIETGLRSIFSGEYWVRAETAVSEFISGLNLKHLFWLGLRGYVGAFLWLAIPTLLFASTRRTEGLPILVTLFGGFLLCIVLSWVPFLQAHFAAENRFAAMFELGTVRKLFRNSPFFWLLSITLALALALPLYLAKVVIPPQDLMFLVTILFVVTIYPVKVLTGWAYHRAKLRPRKAFFAWRWLCWLTMFPILGVYVFILFFTQFIGEHGKAVLFEHHAFLLPAPF